MAQRIVVVEDETIVGLDIKLHLQTFGYSVDGVYTTGEAALEAIAQNPPNLVIMDIRLQGIFDGLETAEVVRSKHGIPIVLLTAHGDEKTLQRAKHSQPFGYIIKPFEPRDLRAAVEIALLRHQMEQAVIQREHRFSTTLANIQDAVIVTDAKNTIEYANPVAENLLRASQDELIGENIADFLKLVDSEGAGVSLHLRGGAQVTALLTDGSKVPVERYCSALMDEAGGSTGWVIVLHDVTERLENERKIRAHEERARQSQKMEAIGRLTGGIAHDFNNLLTVIMGYSRLLTDELAEIDAIDTASLMADVDGIQKAALRSASLTRQLLAFSRNQIMERRSVDLNTVVGDMERMMVRLLGDDIALQVDLLARSATVYADPSQIEQVLLNLVVNARDAMPEGGRLVVMTNNIHVQLDDNELSEDLGPGDFVELVIRDSGVGMDEETLGRIFEPFFTTKEQAQGTGLGLSTVYGIVTQTGGIVDAISTPGGGSEFRVRLPVHHAGPAQQTDTPAHSGESSGDEVVLVVEDEDDVRTLLGRALVRKGYHVLEASNAGEALLQWENFRDEIALVVTDVVMPHLPGTKLVERLRTDSPELKVLLLSAYPEKYLSEDERIGLGHHFMQKPLDPETLVRRVRRILDE